MTLLMPNTYFFYGLSSPNFFMSEGSLVLLAVEIMNGAPSRKQTSFMILNGAKKATVLIVYNDLSVSTKNLNIST